MEWKAKNKDKIIAYIREANDNESLEIALVENIQREDLNPIEIALSYQRLLDEVNLTQEELSARVGKKRSTISNYIRLLRLYPVIQTGLKDRFISMGHAKALISIESYKTQMIAYEKIIIQDLSVRKTEILVKSLLTGKAKLVVEKTEPPRPTDIIDIENQLNQFFNLKASIKINKKGTGTLNISFKTKEELHKIVTLIGEK